MIFRGVCACDFFLFFWLYTNTKMLRMYLKREDDTSVEIDSFCSERVVRSCTSQSGMVLLLIVGVVMCSLRTTPEAKSINCAVLHAWG